MVRKIKKRFDEIEKELADLGEKRVGLQNQFELEKKCFRRYQ